MKNITKTIETLTNKVSPFNLKTHKCSKTGNEFIVIYTNFVDIHHDSIEISMTEKNGLFMLDDDGYTLNELEMMDLSYSDNDDVFEFVNRSLNPFQLQVDDQLIIHTNYLELEKIPNSITEFIQVIIDIYGKTKMYSEFKNTRKEDYEKWKLQKI